MTRQRRQAATREQSLLAEIELGRNRAALSASSAQVDSIFAQNAVGVVKADRHGRIVRVNGRFCQIVGRSPGDLIGQEGRGLLHPDDAAASGASLRAVLEGGAPCNIDVRLLRTDGAAVWVTMAVAPVAGAAGDLRDGARVLAVVLDITASKLAESALREADARKDDFLAMLAHELRNPLAPITAAADLMGMVKLDPARLQQTSKIITRQVRHMTALVDDLLDVSRVTRGLIAIEQRELDFNSVIASAVEQARPLIASMGHHLQVNLPPGELLVSGDHKRLVQVVSNLLNNAAKYTPPGGHLGIAVDTSAGEVRLCVSDDGIGIAPALQQRVFDLFAQAERTPDRSQGGLGLGLALVKNMVELHGGEVWCDSAGAGRGSTFTVRLPRLKAIEEAAAPLDGAAAAGAAAGALRVMLFDDNMDAATMLGMLLENGGHQVIIEYAPHAALARAAADRFDVCVLDIGLPGVDGNELARRLRADPGTAGCTLIALTGYGLDSDRSAALAAGFDYFFAKPVDVTELTQVLRTVRG
ncbi:MAG: sensor histidine kinase [Massilia sp.]|nr:sensor histidine kinase [Massilia sp.]